MLYVSVPTGRHKGGVGVLRCIVKRDGVTRCCAGQFRACKKGGDRIAAAGVKWPGRAGG